jgi:hypothetical protein
LKCYALGRSRPSQAANQPRFWLRDTSRLTVLVTVLRCCHGKVGHVNERATGTAQEGRPSFTIRISRTFVRARKRRLHGVKLETSAHASGSEKRGPGARHGPGGAAACKGCALIPAAAEGSLGSNVQRIDLPAGRAPPQLRLQRREAGTAEAAAQRELPCASVSRGSHARQRTHQADESSQMAAEHASSAQLRWCHNLAH